MSCFAPKLLLVFFAIFLPTAQSGSCNAYTKHSVLSLLSLSYTSGFSPQSHYEIEDAVASCLRLSPVGDCSQGIHGPIGAWDVSAVTDMHSIFSNVYEFNAEISKWDVSAVTNMNEMFSFAKVFNADISKWDVSAVTDMMRMFARAKAFHADISEWDVSAVTDMKGMFYQASSFNADISKWDVSAVIDMTNMLVQSSSFDQVLYMELFGVRVVRRTRARAIAEDISVYIHILGTLQCYLGQFKRTR